MEPFAAAVETTPVKLDSHSSFDTSHMALAVIVGNTSMTRLVIVVVLNIVVVLVAAEVDASFA